MSEERLWFASVPGGFATATGEVYDTGSDTWFATQREAEEAMATCMSLDLEDRQ